LISSFSNSDKKQMADRFASGRRIDINISKLYIENPIKSKQSNFFLVMDKYLTRKRG